MLQDIKEILLSEEVISAKIKELAEKVSKERLVHLIFELSNLQNDMKWSTQNTILFQAGMIKLCDKEVGSGGTLEERVEKIENYLKSRKVVSSNSLAHSNIPVSSVVTNAATSSNTNVRASAGIGAKADGGTSPSTKTSVKANVSFTSGNISAAWPKIVNNLKQNGRIVLYTNLMNTSAKEINDMTVGIEFPNGITSFGKTVLEKQENIYEISKLVSMACGKEMQIKYISGTANVQKAPTPVENIQNLAKESDIPFNVIE